MSKYNFELVEKKINISGGRGRVFSKDIYSRLDVKGKLFFSAEFTRQHIDADSKYAVIATDKKNDAVAVMFLSKKDSLNSVGLKDSNLFKINSPKGCTSSIISKTLSEIMPIGRYEIVEHNQDHLVIQYVRNN